MASSLKAFAVVSALSTYVLVERRPDLLLFSRPSYLGTFVQLWFLQFFLWAVYHILIYPNFVSPIRHLPSPPGGSWWNGQYARIAAEPTGTPMIDWVNSVPNDGLIYYRGLLNRERILVTSPKALGEVLVTKNYDFIKPPDVREGIVRILGNGVLIAEGDEHKVQRKNLMPAFAFRHVKDLYSTFWEKSRETVVAMTKAVKSEEQKQTSATNEKEITSEVAVIEVGNWASRATLDIIGIAGLGKDFGAIKDPDSVLNRTYRTIFKPSPEARLLGLLNFFLPEWFVSRLPIKRNGEIEAAVKVVRSVCKDVISQKKEDLDQNTLDSVDILSVAMQSGGFTDEELVDQMLTFLAAGHETTSSAMTWAIYLLSKYPDIQARLREEVRANLPSPEQDITVDSQKIDHMSYLNAVCNEVLRCFPPVPGTVRNAAKDTTILGHHIPKGTRIMIMPWAVHKNEEFWGPEPGVFNPERWIPSEKNPHSANGGTPNNYSFVTFLHGPRSCIGQGFAKAEFACLLAAWIGRFEFELQDESQKDEKNLDIRGGITAKPASGLHVKVKVVEGW